MSLLDRSRQVGLLTVRSARACVIPGLGIYRILVKDSESRLHSLTPRPGDPEAPPEWTKLTEDIDAPRATSSFPSPIVNTRMNTETVLFNGLHSNRQDVLDIWHHRPTQPEMGWENLSGTAGAPQSASDPVGYYTPADDLNQVFYKTHSRHIHSLFWRGEEPVGNGGDLTANAFPPAPLAKEGPTAFFNTRSGTNIVLYESDDDHIHSLWWSGTDRPGHDSLSQVAGTPPTVIVRGGIGDSYYLGQNDSHQIVYGAADLNIYELFWLGNEPVRGWNLTEAAGAQKTLAPPVAYYHAGTNTKHVIYLNESHHVVDISWIPGATNPIAENLTVKFNLPQPSVFVSAAFTVDGPNTQHVVFLHNPRPDERHLYELIR